MHIDEFREFQREGATYNLASLVMACRRKFLNAARLLEVRSQVIDRLSSFGVDAGVDPWPLLGPFTVLAERYVERFFSPQDNLFQDPMERQDEKWGKYFHHVLVPHHSPMMKSFGTSCAPCERFQALSSPSKLPLP